jgi:REP element-mobilizing transposase RayT
MSVCYICLKKYQMQNIHHSLFHIIICSTGKQKFLTRVNQDILYNYITSVLYQKTCVPISVTGHSNHIHLFIELSVDISVAQIVREILQNTMDFIRREKSVFPEFNGWEKHFLAISYHPSQKSDLLSLLKKTIRLSSHNKL